MDNLLNLTPFAIAAIPITVACTTIVRGFGVPSRALPIVSIAWGMLLLWVAGAEWRPMVMQGLLIGLSASGLWSGGKALIVGKPDGVDMQD